MLVSLSLHKGIVYIPTSYLIKEGPLYHERAPLEVIPVMQSSALRQAILEAVERGNPEMALERYQALMSVREGTVLEASGCKSDYAFDRQMKGSWYITDRSGSYQIRPDRPLKDYGWHEDKDKRVEFPAGTPLGDVITRLIEMIQERERQP